MPTEAKQADIAELVELLKEANTTIVSDHRGLTVADLSKVRRDLRDKDIRYRVVKNRLARIAAEQAGRPELIPLLTGPSALAVGGTDEPALAKGVIDAMRPFKAEESAVPPWAARRSMPRASRLSPPCPRVTCCSPSWPGPWPRR